MKKTILTVALFTVLSTLAVSCQKEESTIAEGTVSSQTDTQYCLHYSIDGKRFHASFATKEERHAFMLHLTALTRDGHRIRMSINAPQRDAANRTETFTTPDPDKAAEWMENMAMQGYIVECFFDEDSGMYICTATIDDGQSTSNSLTPCI